MVPICREPRIFCFAVAKSLLRCVGVFGTDTYVASAGGDRAAGKLSAAGRLSRRAEAIGERKCRLEQLRWRVIVAWEFELGPSEYGALAAFAKQSRRPHSYRSWAPAQLSDNDRRRGASGDRGGC